MNPDATSLRNYIDSQRQNGVPDEAIYHHLISAGWPTEIVQYMMGLQQQNTSHSMQANPLDYGQADISPNAVGLFKGRLNRRGYLMVVVYVISYFSLLVVLSLLLPNANLIDAVILLAGIIGGLAALLLAISSHIRRWHDLGQPGWLTLLNFVPLVGAVASLALFLFPGTKGPNKYGQTHQRSLSPKAVFGLAR